MELIQRKTFRNSIIRSRFRSITTNEMMHLKKLKRFLAVILIKYKIEQLNLIRDMRSIEKGYNCNNS